MKITTVIVSFLTVVHWSTGWCCFPINSPCFQIQAPSKCNQTLNLQSKTRLCPRDTKRGDREFAGHGPKVNASARLNQNGTRVTLGLTLDAVETKRDFTEAKGNWTDTICVVPTGFKIIRFTPDRDPKTAFVESTASYTDNNHKLDTPAVKGDTLVRRFEIMGDTRGKDIGNCTTNDVFMNVHFNSVTLEILRLEKIISNLFAQSDHPGQLVNRLSKGARGITHDNNNWYVSQVDSIWKIPISVDLASIGKLQPASAKVVGIPAYLKRKGYRHYSDSDHYKGRLYISMVGDGVVKNRPLIAVFNTADMNLIRTIPLKQWQTSIASIAISPTAGHLYSAVAGNNSSLKRYRINVSGDNIGLTPLTSYKLLNQTGRALSLDHLNSASFSADGRYLFLLSASQNRGTVWSFNHRTRKVMRTASVPVGPSPQAVSYWNVGSRAPGIRGSLHLLMRHMNAQDRDAISLKHYRITEIFDKNTS